MLATGRSVISAAPIARRLGMTTGPAVCSNGAVSVTLDPAAERGYRITDMITFDPGPALRVIRKELPDAAYAASGSSLRIGLHEVSYSVGWIAWLDLNPKGVTKASALEDLRIRLGVDAADTIAIGDGRNDLDMLRWAGRGVAMGNADDVVRAAADEVTGTIDEDGVVPVLRGLSD